MTIAATPKKRRVPRLSSPQVNLLLSISVSGAVITGVVGWGVGTEWNRVWTLTHAVFGFMTLILAPAKTRTSVKTGMNRGRDTRWISISFGILVLSAILLGFLHSTGIWFGVSTGSALWLHLAAGFISVPLLAWHIWARPIGVRRISLDRRMVIRGGLAAGLAGLTVATTEVAVRVLGAPGADRRFTGSHEIASGNPAEMPVVSWYNDRIPGTTRDAWRLTIDGTDINLDELCDSAQPLTAVLDCTGGWFSEQEWDVVPISDLLDPTARSFKVTSDTGFSNLYPMRDAANVFVGVGYGGEPLRPGHGAPVRIVAPGRRGPWWVKWVVSIELSDRPSWLQSPFPLA